MINMICSLHQLKSNCSSVDQYLVFLTVGFRVELQEPEFELLG